MPYSADVSSTVAHPLVQRALPMGAALGRWLRGRAVDRLRRDWRGLPVELTFADGGRERLGGAGPAVTARVHDDQVFARMLWRGELGLGESYVAGEWDADDLVTVVRRFLRATGARGVESPGTVLGRLPVWLSHVRAQNSRRGSARNIHAHYDLGNAFYQLWLDAPTLAYSCALWPENAAGTPVTDGTDLAAAQTAKFERLCEGLALGPEDHLLEIGCGWGGMAIHAARTRGCRVTAITVSRQQWALARARVAEAGLADRVDIQLRDYRDLEGRFDKVVSIEMIEAVGYAYLPGYFEACARALRPGGRFALQAITMPDDRFEAYRRSVDWMQTYIFPGSLIPSLGIIDRCARTAGLRELSRHDLGLHYAPTLAAWRQRFEAALPQIRALGFDTPFIRAWSMYLAFSEAAFAERTLADHHVIFTA